MVRVILLLVISTTLFAQESKVVAKQQVYPTANINLDVFLRSAHWDGTIMTSHNGGILYGPQDTILVFDKSCQMGADIIEVDIRITKDNHLIAFHDKEFHFLNSTGSGIVRECTLEYIRTIRTRSFFANVPPQPIPTFRETLKFLRDKNVCLNVEPKDNVIVEIIRDVVAEKMEERVLIQAKSPNRAKLIRSLNSKVGIIARYRQESDVDGFAPYHPEIMEVDPSISDTIIARIKANGTKIQMKTGYLKDLDYDERLWQKRINRGVNVTLSDFVPEMVNFLRRTAFNMGSEAKPRSGSAQMKGRTYINISEKTQAKKDGTLKYARIFIAEKGKAKIKIFRPIENGYQLVYETKLTMLKKGLNVVGINAKVKQGDYLGMYLESAQIEVSPRAAHKSLSSQGDVGSGSKNLWAIETYGFSLDGMIR